MDGYYRLTDGRLFKAIKTVDSNTVTLIARPSFAHPKPETLVLTSKKLERDFTTNRELALERQRLAERHR